MKLTKVQRMMLTRCLEVVLGLFILGLFVWFYIFQKL